MGIDINESVSRHIGNFRDGDTALTYVIKHGPVNLMRLLIDKGADVNSNLGEAGRLTPLDAALTDSGSDIQACILIENGAVIDGKTGEMALASAVHYDYFETVKLLIAKGVNINSVTGGGSPLRIAKKRGHDRIVEYLKENGGVSD